MFVDRIISLILIYEIKGKRTLGTGRSISELYLPTNELIIRSMAFYYSFVVDVLLRPYSSHDWLPQFQPHETTWCLIAFPHFS